MVGHGRRGASLEVKEDLLGVTREKGRRHLLAGPFHSVEVVVGPGSAMPGAPGFCGKPSRWV